MTKKIISLVLILATLFSIGAVSFTVDGAVLQNPKKNSLQWRNYVIYETKSITNTQNITIPFVSYTDVPVNRWSYQSIAAATAFNLMEGVGNGLFAPTSKLNRGQFNAMIERLKKGKIITGDYSANTNWITRQDVIYTLWWLVPGWPDPGVDIPTKYKDQNQIPNWAKMAWAWCISKGIISGTTETTLEPYAYITREQAATVFINYILAYYGGINPKTCNIVTGTPKRAVVADHTGLNLRKMSNTSASATVRMLMPYNDEVIVYGVFNSWAVVKHVNSGYFGFCSANLLNDKQQSNTCTGYVNTKTDPLNLRKYPNASAPIIGTIPRGSAVKVFDNKQTYNGFYHIEYNGKEGYASASYIIFTPITNEPLPIQEFVKIAQKQVGISGRPNKYTYWYGPIGGTYSYAWCAAFVSWCEDQCGYISSGLAPKFAGCSLGLEWFKNRGQWKTRSTTPNAGMIIFFDWDYNGSPDHVGIVEYVSNGRVYTIEGNSGNAVKRQNYPLSSGQILGYGYINTSTYRLYKSNNTEGVSLSEKSMSLNIGEKSKLSANVVLPDVSDKSVTWYSSNPNVVTVDENGNLKAIKEGKVTIVAYANAKSSVVAYCNITVGKDSVIKKNDTEISTEITKAQTEEIAENAEIEKEIEKTETEVQAKIETESPKCNTEGNGTPSAPSKYLKVRASVGIKKYIK